MKFHEIGQKIKSGEITLDSCGHQISTHRTLIDIYNDIVANANGAGDNKWRVCEDESKSDINLRMRKFYQGHLDQDYHDEDTIHFPFAHSEKCFGCGENLSWIFNGDRLTLREFYNPDKPRKRPDLFGSMGDFDRYPLDYRCPYEHPKPFCGSIKVTSPLVFVNFFRNSEDAPSDVQYSDEWSLSYLRGRENITRHKCSQNIAYGQMDNMSIGVYVNSTKDVVIIGPAYHPVEWDPESHEMTDEEYKTALSKPLFDDFEMVGTIDLRVWRWEATDLNTIGIENYDALKEDQDCYGVVEIDVQHGAWNFEHYFDRLNEKTDHCYSKLYLVKN